MKGTSSVLSASGDSLRTSPSRPLPGSPSTSTRLPCTSTKSSNERIAAYIIREHDRGRTLEDILDDPYVVNRCSQTVVKIAPGGATSVFAGTGTLGHSGDGGPARKARLYAPSFVTVDLDRNVYVSDTGNGRIRRISPDGTITTFAGF